MRALIVLLCLAGVCAADTAPEEVTIPSNGYKLHGCVWKPDGMGPFATVIYNHGSEQNPRPCGPPDLGNFYRSHGYLFVAFQRHGHGQSPGEYIGDLQNKLRAQSSDPAVFQREMVKLHEAYNLDVAGAVEWLKQQPYVDASRMVMTGVSFGGIQTVLSAEKGMGIRCFLAFAPGAMSWNPVLAERLVKAVRNAKAPIFELQAENDYSLFPSEVLGKELQKKGPPNRAKVYPKVGETKQEGHASFAVMKVGIPLWSADGLEFIQGAIGK